MILVPLFFLTIFLFFQIEQRERKHLLPILLGFLFLYLLYFILFNLIEEKGSLLFWPDSAHYYSKSLDLKEVLVQVLKGERTLAEVNINSRNFGYYIYLSLLLNGNPNLDLLLLFVANCLTLTSTFLVTYSLHASVLKVKTSRLSVAVFASIFFLFTSIGFWSLFLLKETITALFFILTIHSAAKRRYVFLVLSLVMVLIFRWYLFFILIASISLSEILKSKGRLFEKRNVVITGIALILVYIFVPEEIVEYMDRYFYSQQLWAADAARNSVALKFGFPISALLIMVKMVLTPVFPAESITFSLYSYLFWKLGIGLCITRLIMSRKSIRIREINWMIILPIGLVFCFYAFFPMFANFRHRLIVEPLFTVLICQATLVGCFRFGALNQIREPK